MARTGKANFLAYNKDSRNFEFHTDPTQHALNIK